MKRPMQFRKITFGRPDHGIGRGTRIPNNLDDFFGSLATANIWEKTLDFLKNGFFCTGRAMEAKIDPLNFCRGGVSKLTPFFRPFFEAFIRDPIFGHF